jgi:3-(3-hydroxy-phenyl)propionate hydroxylase
MPTPQPFAATQPQSGYEFSGGTGYVLPEYPFATPPELRAAREGVYDIVIVGAGLSGLTLACSLAQLGVDALVLDEDNTVGVKGASSRGICYTQKSLEIFDRLGVYARIAAKGVRWHTGRTFAGHDEVYSFDLRQGPATLSQQPPFINIQQFYIEGFLVERIQALTAQRPSVDLRWQNRVLHVQTTAGGAQVRVGTPEGDYTLHARYLIDATGANSPIRKALGVQGTTKRGDDRWCIADIRFGKNPPAERHTWIEAPFNDNRAVWQHKMADEVWRIDYQMAPDSDAAYVSREDVVRERLARQFGADAGIELVWVGPYAYRSELVERMSLALGTGAVFFLGDAAKVVSPFGARGGNSGIADADNLAWKLAAVVQGRAHPALLASYHAERMQANATNVQVTNRTARFLRPADGAERILRDAAIALAKRHAFARPLINTGRMAVANTYTDSPALHTSGGVSVVNAAFRYADGNAATLNDALRRLNGRLLLLVFGGLTRADAGRVRALTDSGAVVAAQVVRLARDATTEQHFIDAQSFLAQACEVDAKGWALIRPDGYRAAAQKGSTAIHGTLITAIEKCLGLP